MGERRWWLSLYLPLGHSEKHRSLTPTDWQPEWLTASRVVCWGQKCVFYQAESCAKAQRACAKWRNNEAKKRAIKFSLSLSFRSGRQATGGERCGRAPVPMQRPLVGFGAAHCWVGQTSSCGNKVLLLQEVWTTARALCRIIRIQSWLSVVYFFYFSTPRTPESSWAWLDWRTNTDQKLQTGFVVVVILIQRTI